MIRLNLVFVLIYKLLSYRDKLIYNETNIIIHKDVSGYIELIRNFVVKNAERNIGCPFINFRYMSRISKKNVYI